jgi:predicted metal-dependent enzyme (double-stranded beta helix superfamily)
MNRVAAQPTRAPSSSEEITMEPDGLRTFIDDVGRMVSSTDDEYEITKRVAERLSDLLAGGYRLPPEVTRPTPVHHVTYPLYIAPDGSWSMASVVWDVGQRTPVHSHETWGVVGNLLGSRTRGPVRQADGVHRGRGWDSPEGGTPQLRSNW